MVITSTVATSSAMFKIAAKAAKALSGNKNMAESFTGAIANIGKVFKKGSEGSKGNAISKKIHQIGKRNLDKTMKVVKMIPQILKIVVAVLLVMAIANLAMALSSFLGFLTSLTNYNLTFPYESLDDRNLDTEVVAYDILYETFYDTISETSYYQVFNTTFTVGIQGQEEDLGLIGNLLRGWRVKDVSSTGAGVPGRTNSVFDMYVVAYDSIASVLNSVKNEGMDIRMTVHDANMRPIYGLQKALSYSDSYDRDIAEASNELSLFRDYYGRENEFAISSGLLKELNDKVLNNPVGNAGENSIAYPEAFTKPVQFSYDYFRTRPYFTGDRDDDGNDINKWEDYTYITRRVLYEDIRNNAKISVSKEVMGDTISGVYTDFIDGEMTAEEIFNNKAKKNEEIGDNLITLASSLFSEIFTDTSKIENKYDMEGFIVSAASPYLYENIVLERNTRQDMQNVAGEKKYDYLAMNNVSKYATIKRYNQYSEYPEERQVRLYWRQVKKEGNNVTTTSKTSSVFDVTRDFLFTKKGENGKVFGIADGTVAGEDYVQGSNAFYGEKDGVFEFNSTSIKAKNTIGTEYYLDGPYASIEDMLAGQKIPVYDMSNGALPDNWWNNSSYNQYSRPLETYSAKDESIDFGTGDTKGKVNARIMVVKAGEGDNAVYGYQIGYDQWPIIKTEEKIDNNPDASATSQPSTEPSGILDLIDDTPKYYTWSTWDDNTKAKGTQMLTECILTFPEKHYQLAQLETDQDGLVATGRVNFNTGEFQRVAVKDSYRRSMKYQSDLRDYIANMMSNENFVKSIEDKCYGNTRGSFIMLGRKMQAFFSNMGSLISEGLRRSDIDHQIDQLELASDYIRNGKPEININTGSLVELNAAHIVSSYNGKTYSKDGKQFSYITGEVVSANDESDDLKYDAILESKNKSNEVRNNICSTILTIIGCLQDEKEQDVNYTEIEMGEKEAAYLIYLFETRAVIPNGKIGQELEYSGSFRNYTDTTGLSSSIYDVLETWYSQEYEVGFNAAIVSYLRDNNLLGSDVTDDNMNDKAVDYLTNHNVYYDKHPIKDENGNEVEVSISSDFSSTINPFPGIWRIYEETEWTPPIFRLKDAAVALYHTFFGGGEEENEETGAEGEEENLGKWINEANYSGNALHFSGGELAIPSLWEENDPDNGKQVYRKEKRLPSPYDVLNDVRYAFTGIRKNTKLETTLLAEFVSSGYLPTSISYSYGKTPSGETARSMISDENSEAGKGLSGWWNSLKENRSVSAGNGSMIAMIGAGEDTSWGYDVAGNLHIGETQLVNIFETDEGINLLKYYTGLDISLWNKNRLAQRFLNTMTTNSNKQYSNDKISSSTVKVTNPNGDGMIEMTLQEKPMLRMDYEYRIRDSILDMDAWRVRSFSQGYDILPYETRSVRDYGLASILEYIEGVSVQFKRGLYYDERYSDYAVNAFVYWLKNSDLNGLVDTSKYQYDDTNTSNPYIYDELERGFYPAEYFTIGADSSNPEVSTNLLRDKFILGDATEMGEEAGRGGGAISSASDAFTQAMKPDGNATEPPEINNTYTYERGDIQSPANATDMNGLNNGWAALTFADKSGNEHPGIYFIMDINSSNGVTDTGEEITVYYYDVIENGKTDADIIYLKRIETETKFTQIDKRETGQTTITGSFLDESVSMPTSGEVVNADSLLLDYYDYLRNKSDVIQPVAPKIYFNCFVPYMSDKQAETYKEPNKYYISWLQRAIDLDKNDDRYQDLNTLSTALKLQASRTFVLNSELVKEDALASKIKAYFKGVPGDRPQENLPLSFISNLTLPDGANGGRYVFNNLYKNIDLSLFGFINLTVAERKEAQDNGVININNSSFNLGESLDTAIAKYWLDGAGTEKLSKEDYSRQIGEYTYIDDASVESMFLISQAVTFLGRFEYTYKDTVESISALSDYDSQRLIGLYYYDRYVELKNTDMNYYAIQWDYGSIKMSHSGEDLDCYPDKDSDEFLSLVKERSDSYINRNDNLYHYLVKNDGYLFDQIVDAGIDSNQKAELETLIKNGGIIIVDSTVDSISCSWTTQVYVGKDEETGEPQYEDVEHNYTSEAAIVSYKIPRVVRLTPATMDSLGLETKINHGNEFVENSQNFGKNNLLRIYDDMICEHTANSKTRTIDFSNNVVTVDAFIKASQNDKWNMYSLRSETEPVNIKHSVSLIRTINDANPIEDGSTWQESGFYLMPSEVEKKYPATVYTTTIKKSISCSSSCESKETKDVELDVVTNNGTSNNKGYYESPLPILMLCCGTDGAIEGNGTDNRAVGKTGPLNRNYIGSNWKIYLKEMDFYCDGETVKSWGDRLIFNDDENAMVNPAYYDFGKDVKLEKDRKTKYFESYLKYFETYIPSRVKTDSDLQERVDLVQNMADLMANGNLVITKDLTPMFLNEVSKSYWDPVFKAFDKVFAQVELGKLTDLQKRKAFAQIIQGIFEVKFMDSVETNMLACRINSKLPPWTDSNKYEVAAETMKDIMIKSCSFSSAKSVNDFNEAAKRLIENNMGRDLDNWGCFEEMYANPYKYFLKNGLALGFGSFRVQTTNSSGQIEIVLNKPSNSSSLEGAGGRGFAFGYESWYDDIDGLDDKVLITLDSGNDAADGRFIATEVLPFIADQFIINLNQNIDINQTIYETLYGKEFFTNIKSSGADLSKNDGYNGHEYEFSGTGSFAAGYYPSGYGDANKRTELPNASGIDKVYAFVKDRLVRKQFASINVAHDNTQAGNLEEMVSKDYALGVVAAYSKQYLGWNPSASVGLMSYMTQEGGKMGTFSYEANGFLAGPDGKTGSTYLNNEEWFAWLKKAETHKEMVRVYDGKTYSSSHWAIGLGLLQDSDVWDNKTYGTDPLPETGDNGVTHNASNLVKIAMQYSEANGGDKNSTPWQDPYFQIEYIFRNRVYNVPGSWNMDENFGFDWEPSGPEDWKQYLNHLAFDESDKESCPDPTAGGNTAVYEEKLAREYARRITAGIGMPGWDWENRDETTAAGKGLKAHENHVDTAKKIYDEHCDDDISDIIRIKGAMGVSARNNLASQLLKMELKDYRAFTSTTLELVTRHIAISDIENIIRQTPNYKSNHEKSVSEASFDEIFGNDNKFNILDLLGTSNSEGLYRRKASGSYEYAFQGTYDGICLGDVAWNTADWEGNEAIVYVALREAANTNAEDKNGEKYWKAFPFNGWVHWCACFAQWCASRVHINDDSGIVGEQMIPYTAGCISWKNNTDKYGGEVVPYNQNVNPAPGSFVLFQRGTCDSGHVGIIVGSDDKYIYTIEGNTTPYGGKWTQGISGYQAVRLKQYSRAKNDISYYVNPHYERYTDKLLTIDDLMSSTEDGIGMQDWAGDGSKISFAEYFAQKEAEMSG